MYFSVKTDAAEASIKSQFVLIAGFQASLMHTLIVLWSSIHQLWFKRRRLLWIARSPSTGLVSKSKSALIWVAQQFDQPRWWSRFGHRKCPNREWVILSFHSTIRMRFRVFRDLHLYDRRCLSVCLFVTFYPHFLKWCLPSWAPEAWSETTHKYTHQNVKADGQL